MRADRNVPNGCRTWSRPALAGLALATAAAAAAVASGLGYRADWWPFTTGFVIFEWAAYGPVFAVVLAVAGAVPAHPGVGRRGLVPAPVAALRGGKN